MTESIRIDGKPYNWPTDIEWQKMKPAQRRIRALRLLAQAVRQENRQGPASSAVSQALFLAEDALGSNPNA